MEWNAAAGLLNAVYLTLWKHPYIVNVPNLKNLIGTCQCLVVGEDSLTSLTDHHGPSGRRPELPPQGFCSIVFKLVALQVWSHFWRHFFCKIFFQSFHRKLPKLCKAKLQHFFNFHLSLNSRAITHFFAIIKFCGVSFIFFWSYQLSSLFSKIFDKRIGCTSVQKGLK